MARRCTTVSFQKTSKQKSNLTKQLTNVTTFLLWDFFVNNGSWCQRLYLSQQVNNLKYKDVEDLCFGADDTWVALIKFWSSITQMNDDLFSNGRLSHSVCFRVCWSILVNQRATKHYWCQVSRDCDPSAPLYSFCLSDLRSNQTKKRKLLLI